MNFMHIINIKESNNTPVDNIFMWRDQCQYVYSSNFIWTVSNKYFRFDSDDVKHECSISC